tara:strand:- start:98 stop:2362 length:2265 start_codon:yes stop_codon:yes gene_type:complete
MGEAGCLKDANFQNIQSVKIAASDSVVINNQIITIDPSSKNLKVGGKVVSPATELGSGLAVGENINVNGKRLTGVQDPTSEQDAATKAYVDSGSITLTDKTISSGTLTGSLTAGGGTGTPGQVLTSSGTGVEWTNSSGGISFYGSTANGMLTYKDADEATVESNITFNGSTFYLYSTAPEIRIKSSNTSNGVPLLTMIGGDGENPGDGWQIKTDTGAMTFSSDHNSVETYNRTILTLNGNNLVTSSSVDVAGHLNVASDINIEGDIDMATEKKVTWVNENQSISGTVSGITLTSGGTVDIQSSGNITMDSSGGSIGLGTDADANAINVGTGAAARTITIGNVTGATSVNLNAGTDGLTLESTGTGSESILLKSGGGIKLDGAGAAPHATGAAPAAAAAEAGGVSITGNTITLCEADADWGEGDIFTLKMAAAAKFNSGSPNDPEWALGANGRDLFIKGQDAQPQGHEYRDLYGYPLSTKEGGNVRIEAGFGYGQDYDTSEGRDPPPQTSASQQKYMGHIELEGAKCYIRAVGTVDPTPGSGIHLHTTQAWATVKLETSTAAPVETVGKGLHVKKGGSPPSGGNLTVQGDLEVNDGSTSKMKLTAESGDLEVAGTVTAEGNQLTSDRRWKKNITNIANCLDSILALRPVYYNWGDDSPMSHKAKSMQLGFVAQEMQDALPRRGEGVVAEINEEGYLGVSYSKLTTLLAGAVQEQQAMIDELKTQNSQLRAQQEAMRMEQEALRMLVEELMASTSG